MEFVFQAMLKKINLQKPKLITPTRTRKLLATMLQLLDMNDSKDVHFAWYRKEDANLELTKVAKVLLAIDNGEELKSKSIKNLLETLLGANIFINIKIRNCLLYLETN